MILASQFDLYVTFVFENMVEISRILGDLFQLNCELV